MSILRTFDIKISNKSSSLKYLRNVSTKNIFQLVLSQKFHRYFKDKKWGFPVMQLPLEDMGITVPKEVIEDANQAPNENRQDIIDGWYLRNYKTTFALF